MSGLTPLPVTHFRRSLRARGSNLATLADELGLSRNHLSQVLHGRRPGAEVWPLLQAALPPEEWSLLLRLQHCSAWNNSALAAGESALVWRMPVICGACQKREGFKPCVRAVAGKATHGICPDCLPALAARAGLTLPNINPVAA